MADLDAYPGWPSGQTFKIVGQTPAMVALFRRGVALAKSGKPPLILAPPGCGRYLFARAIHAEGPYASGAFIRESCGNRTPERLRLDLFGDPLGSAASGTGVYAAGSGGTRSRAKVPETCRFYEARRGTLYLTLAHQVDAITQNRLVEVLTGALRFRNTPMPAGTVRLSFASYLDLKSVKRRFVPALWDLLYEQIIEIPPLRERVEDIPPLVHYFVQYYAARGGFETKPIQSQALEALQGRSWPGNVRELEQLTEMALGRSEGPELTVDDFLAGLPDYTVGSSADGQSLAGYYEDEPEPESMPGLETKPEPEAKTEPEAKLEPEAKPGPEAPTPLPRKMRESGDWRIG